MSDMRIIWIVLLVWLVYLMWPCTSDCNKSANVSVSHKGLSNTVACNSYKSLSNSNHLNVSRKGGGLACNSCSGKSGGGLACNSCSGKGGGGLACNSCSGKGGGGLACNSCSGKGGGGGLACNSCTGGIGGGLACNSCIGGGGLAQNGASNLKPMPRKGQALKLKPRSRQGGGLALDSTSPLCRQPSFWNVSASNDGKEFSNKLGTATVASVDPTCSLITLTFTVRQNRVNPSGKWYEKYCTMLSVASTDGSKAKLTVQGGPSDAYYATENAGGTEILFRAVNAEPSYLKLSLVR